MIIFWPFGPVYCYFGVGGYDFYSSTLTFRVPEVYSVKFISIQLFN